MVSLTRPTVDSLNASVPIAGRAEALAEYERLPVPTSADEAWRYIDHDLDPDRLALAVDPGPAMAADLFVSEFQSPSNAVMVDGHTLWARGSNIESGVRVLGLVEPSLDKFAAAHLAFVTGGVVVEVPAGATPANPVLVDLQTVSDGVIAFPHVTIQLGANSEASVVLVSRSPAGVGAVAVPQVEVDLADSARLRLLLVQNLGLEASNITQLRARLGRDSSLRLGEVGLGAHLGRLDLGVVLEGQGSSADVVGVFFGHREQTLDYRMRLTHVGRKTSSRVLLKGAVEDAAQSIFAGLVRIEKPAIGASAFETNRNLVLSPQAKAQSIPNLEILCDDVMCGHGSSVGPLDEEHLYYLQSRGLRRAPAERLLVRGFFSEVLDRLPVKGLEAALADFFERRFAHEENA
ncbi:MAG TPA: Fe-S cluster assembly protein SufD [Acidimicrobiia bacterium]|nr:Fe-S cluster assembly protein SufD [Acidimicrobiia bacterium]